MIPLVIDSSVAIEWLLTEAQSSEARLILDEYDAGIVLLLAPDLIFAEVGNVLWMKQRFNELEPQDAASALQAFHGLDIDVTPTSVLLDDAYAFISAPFTTCCMSR